MKNRVLVVDDHKIVQKQVEKAISSQGLKLAFAQTGEEALAAVDAFRPDLVVLDIMMPGAISGYEVCRRIKSRKETADSMVLLLSTKSSLESRMHGYEAMADDYMIKPFDAKELAAKAGILLRLKNAIDDLGSVNRNLTALVESRTRELVRREQQALIGELVQGLVHNIRGPLTVARSRAELTAAMIREPQEVAGALEAFHEQLLRNQSLVLDAVGKVENLVENLLQKSREKASVQNRPIDLKDLIHRELVFLEADPKIHRTVKKRFTPAENLPMIFGVYADFSQVIYNLVKNATEAMENSEVKELEIGTRFDGDHVFIEFADSGSGIDPEVQRRIFEPFFSTKNGVGGEKGGSGLGLYTCVQLMEPYGASISVENRTGGGSRFTVAVPRPVAPEKAHPSP